MIYKHEIRREKKRKAAVPDDVPIKILKTSPAVFAEMLYELFAAGARLRCMMNYCDVSIFISLYKKKVLIAVPAHNRPLRLILIMRKILEMETTVRLVKECPDEL